MITEDLTITGMSCGGCVKHLEKQLGLIPGLRIDQAAVGSARVTYDESRTTGADLARAIEGADFRLVDRHPSILPTAGTGKGS
jgi:copper chaperone CopZ